MSSANQAGKGDKPRPINKQAYDQNFDGIERKGIVNGVLVKNSKGKLTYKY